MVLLLVLSLFTARVDEHVGAQLPLATPFTSATEGATTLGAALGERPALLVLAYARCTMLCNLVLRGTIQAARGRDVRLVVVSLDDRETVDEARRKQASMREDLGRDFAYLVGARANIDAVANPLGFRYAWEPTTEQYAHPAVIFAITPDGRVARYLHGLSFDPKIVDEALADAAAGRMLTTAAADVLRCFRSPRTDTAGKRVQLVLRGVATLCLLSLFVTVAVLVIRERRRGA